MAKINGRTLKGALRDTKTQHRFKTIPLTDWIDVCPRCDSSALRSKSGIGLPFLCSDGFMQTVADLPDESAYAPFEPLVFARFGTSRNALKSAIELVRQEDPSTEKIETHGRMLVQNTTYGSAASISFSEEVCKWGRGQRVWANIIRRNSIETLGEELSTWFREAAHSNDCELAISGGLRIDGLGVSFASKHLRMIAPSIFPVLDQVLSEGLGFALNPKGYALFKDMLAKFKEEYGFDQGIATLGPVDIHRMRRVASKCG
ncbi:MAG TPA: hypothetical protein VJ733_04740 [Candidatus Binatia bacterium]|nr:hypothetical protein [Candidatus Binatia bacterium]